MLVMALETAVDTATAAHAEASGGGGLPQLNVLFDGSFTNQVFWLVASFLFLYFLFSQVILPRIGGVLTEREERIAADHDRARAAQQEAEKIKDAYEQALATARQEAQTRLADAKTEIQASLAKAQADLDATLAKEAEAADASIAAAVDEAMSEIGTVATEIAGELIGKLTGEDVSDAAVHKAVTAQIDQRKAG